MYYYKKLEKMKFENFRKVLDTIRDFDKTITAIEGMNIGMIDSNICTDFWELQRLLFNEVYTEEGYEWISYYLYEIPLLEENARKKGEPTNDDWVKDEKGNPIDLSSDEALWDFLENNCSRSKKYCSAVKN